MFTFWPVQKAQSHRNAGWRGLPEALRSPSRTTRDCREHQTGAGGAWLCLAEPQNAQGQSFRSLPDDLPRGCASLLENFSSRPVWTLHAALCGRCPLLRCLSLLPRVSSVTLPPPSVYIIWVTLGNRSARANICVWNCKVGALACNCIRLLNFQLSCGTREGKPRGFPTVQSWC